MLNNSIYSYLAKTTTSQSSTTTTSTSKATTSTTTSATTTSATTTSATTTSSASSSTGAAHYAQCGGIGWTGATAWCVSEKTSVCSSVYSQSFTQRLSIYVHEAERLLLTVLVEAVIGCNRQNEKHNAINATRAQR